MIDTLNELDNVLFEVTNEGGNKGWDRFVVDTVHDYEKAKPKRHPVGLTGHGSESNDEMLASPADWFSPGSSDWPDLKADPARRRQEGQPAGHGPVFGVGGDRSGSGRHSSGPQCTVHGPVRRPRGCAVLAGQKVGVRDAEAARWAMGLARSYAKELTSPLAGPPAN